MEGKVVAPMEVEGRKGKASMEVVEDDQQRWCGLGTIAERVRNICSSLCIIMLDKAMRNSSNWLSV